MDVIWLFFQQEIKLPQLLEILVFTGVVGVFFSIFCHEKNMGFITLRSGVRFPPSLRSSEKAFTNVKAFFVSQK